MKKLIFIIATVFTIQVGSAQTGSFDYFGQTPPGNTPGLAADMTGSYFGQTPPGETPQLFAPGILTQPNGVVAVTRIAFSPDGNECFFSGPTDWNFSSTRMYYTKCVNNVWTPQVLAPFYDTSYAYRQAYFSADGNTLYFSSNKNGTSDIWMVVRTSQGWGTPQVLPEPINSSSYDGMYTQTADGTVYIESNRSGGHGNIDVWRISQQPGQPQQIQNFGAPVNTSGDDNDPFVSPDGRYLIFGSNYNDLFVTFNKGNGGWTAPVNLNQYYPGINTGDQEYAPSISHDGRYLFFTRITGGGVYWVSTSSIDSLRNNNFPPYLKSQIPNQTDTVGHLFGYTVPDSTFIDDDGNNTLNYIAKLTNTLSLPSWLTFNAETRTFSGTPAAQGILNIKVTATDTANASVSCQFKITIVAGPAGVEKDKNQLPIKLMLNQNYPNPTSGQITKSLDIKKGLVAYYPFNGNANDESGNNNNGKITGAVFVADKFGKSGNALNLNGVDNCVEIASSPTINITGSLSISCWIFPRRAGRWESWVAKVNNNGSRSQWRFGFGDPAPASFGLTVWNSDWSDHWTNKKAIPLNTWSHVILVADQQQHVAYYYLNGELVDTITGIKEFSGSNDPLFIGHQKDDFVFFDGLIDEVRIYNRPLNTDEVKKLFKQFNINKL
jgi:Tol biopolymer transport system component